MLLHGLIKVIDVKDIIRILRTPVNGDSGLVRFNLFQELVAIAEKVVATQMSLCLACFLQKRCGRDDVGVLEETSVWYWHSSCTSKLL